MFSSTEPEPEPAPAPGPDEAPGPTPPPGPPPPPPPPPPQVRVYYYLLDANHQVIGPFSLDDIKGRIAAGTVKPADLIWKTGLPAWVAVSTLEELNG